MKIHTTNYTNTLIEAAEDCLATSGEVPPVKGEDKSIANMQFDMISQHPYKYNSDDVLFHCFATKKDLKKDELKNERALFFSKGQPCFRSSPLTKRYGWGIHNNEEGKVALFAVETDEYKKMVNDKKLKVVKAMRTKRN